jgi:hypothetical protein
MVETFTPAVCGSRTRQRVAAALFAASALATAAALGALLGLAGATLGADRAVLAAAGLALLAAAREARLVRLPLPQSRRQVPERWRFELPLPVWASGYGAGLGAGFLTYQPVATFWVACAGALALARPLPAALCFALYGAGRALTLVWPRRRLGAAEVVERIAARRPALLRANVAGLAACAALLALAPTAEGARITSGLDPSTDRGPVALATQGGSVVVRRRGPDVHYQNASSPSIYRGLLAYVDSSGIRVVRWSDGKLIRRIKGAVSRPSLKWPLLAFRRDVSRTSRLVLRNLKTGRARQITKVSRSHDLGRPSLRRGRLAWHVTTRKISRIYYMRLSGRPRVLIQSRVALVRNPALSDRRLLWTVERSGRAYLRVRHLRTGSVRTIARIRGRNVGYWTTALGGRKAYVTRWSLPTGRATMYKYRF